MSPRKLAKWCASSLIGHLVLWELLCAVPLTAMFIATMLSEGAFTFGWTIFIATLAAVLFGIGGALFWYTLSTPLIARRNRI
jgi:cytochrome b561